MTDEAALRAEMVRIGRLMFDRQLVVAAEGNLSARLGGDRFLVTPAGHCKGELTAAAPVPVDLQGQPAGDFPAGARPSSEWRLHREIYGVRADVAAVCHGHPPWATAFAAAGQALDGCLLPEVVATLGAVPLAPYATPGTEEVPRAVRDLIAGHDTLLLANHGVVAVGATLAEAFFRLETVERLAQVTLLARLAGGERRLSGGEVAALRGGRDAGHASAPCVTGGESVPGGLDDLVEGLARGILQGMARRA
jgi:L-fuculose-phosphate aldolase